MSKKYRLSPRCLAMSLEEVAAEIKRLDACRKHAEGINNHALAYAYEKDINALRVRENELVVLGRG